MASAAYNLGINKLMGGSVSLSADTIKVRPVRVSAYTFSQSHEFVSSLPASITTSVTLGSKTLTTGIFDAADAVFTAVGAGAAIDACVLFKDTGVESTSPLVLYLDGFSVTPNGGDITFQWAAADPNIWKISP